MQGFHATHVRSPGGSLRGSAFWTALLGLFLPLVGCGGDADFGGSGSRKKSEDNTKADAGGGDEVDEPPGDDSANLSPYASLTWYWQCATDPVNVPAPTEDDAIVENEGPHEMQKSKLAGTPVTISGHLCPPAQLPRDIMFVIDTSGSMGGTTNNDPRIGDTCGRLQAVESVIAAAPAGSARFGITTFSSTVDATTSGLFETKDQLFANIAPGGNIADVLCAANGSTNYGTGLDRAEVLLKGGRADATKEIYFVSDGQPSDGTAGPAKAQTLKTVGVNIGTEFIPVTIATVMLAGVDTVLESEMASRDANGKALHAYVAQTGELTKALTDLAANEIVSAELSYRPMGGGDWIALDLMSHLQGYDFTLPPFTIDIEDGAPGLEVLYEYRDRHDHRVATGGKILWTTDAGGGG